jgi:hypothetical protein
MAVHLGTKTPAQTPGQRARELGVVFLVFGITGTLAVVFARLVLNGLIGMEGNFFSGPWSYRLVYLLLVPPFYSVTLIAVGTLFGRHQFFRRRVVRMWAFLIPPLRRFS